MVAGRAIEQQGDEHLEGSKSANPASAFHSDCPSKTINRPGMKSQKGHFENLEQRIAIGIPIGHSVAGLLELLEVTERDNKNINQANPRMKDGVKPTLADKQRWALHYMMECLYQLCLAPADNISSNPGWEQFLRFYGK